MDTADIAKKLASQGHQISQLVSGIRVASALLSSALGVHAILAISQTPYFKRLFDDMFQGREMNSWSANLLLAYPAFFALIAMVLAIVPAVIAFRTGNVFVVIVTTAVGLLLQLSLLTWVSSTLASPMKQILLDLGS